MRENFLFLFICLLFYLPSPSIQQKKSLRATSCGPLYPPKNGGFSCTRGSKFGSKCTLKCGLGYIDSKLMVNHGKESSRICSCVGDLCTWIGPEFKCQEFTCPEPDFVNGRIAIVDRWSDGFNAVIEFSDIPEPIFTGWSLKLYFNPPLGVNTKVTTWSSVMSSSSLEFSSLTLVNTMKNADISKGLHRSFLRTSIVIEKVEDLAYRQVFVGLYLERHLNLDCYIPDIFSMKQLKPMPVFTGDLIAPDKTTDAVDKVEVEIPVTEKAETTRKITTTKAPTTAKKTTTTTTTTEAEVVVEENVSEEGLDYDEKEEKEEEEKEKKEEKEATTEEDEEAEEDMNGEVLLEDIDGKRCKVQTISPYFPQRGWREEGDSFYSIASKVNVEVPTPNWVIAIVFGATVKSIEVWNALVLGDEFDGRVWKFGPVPWNRNLRAGNFDMSFNAKFDGILPFKPNGRVYLCSSVYSKGGPIYDIKEEFRFLESLGEEPHVGGGGGGGGDGGNTAPTPTEPPAMTAKPLSQYKTPRCKSGKNGENVKKATQTEPKWKNSTGTGPDYNEILHKSLLFYDAQRAGILPKFNRIPWRGNSTMRDGCDAGLDLSGGWFDAGDTVKFTFPMAATLTNLIWGGIVYKDAYKESGNYPHLLQSLRWAATYLMRAHPSRYELVVMVGDPKKDHSFWGRPEELNMYRPVYKINRRNPGTEVAAETAASLAAASIIFKDSYSNLAKAALKHAKGLYDFATKFKGDYHVSVPLVQSFYKSWSGYDDELVWAAAWLYKATNDKFYLDQAKKQYSKMRGQYLAEREVSWDRKMISAQILLANMTGDPIFRNPIDRFMANVMRMSKTPQGIMYLNEWAPNRYAANAAMCAILASDLNPPLPKSDIYFKWGEDQIHRIMGLKGGRSYIIGVGKDWPQRPHHRSSSCPFPPAPCNHQQLHANEPNPITLFGALVGGPGLKGTFLDNRNDYRQNEVALDYNAGWQTAIAGLKNREMKRSS